MGGLRVRLQSYSPRTAALWKWCTGCGCTAGPRRCKINQLSYIYIIIFFLLISIMSAPLISEETRKNLLSSLAGSSVIFDGEQGSSLLVASDHDIELVGLAVSLAQKNNSADDFHNIFRLALTANAWRKMGDKLQEKKPGDNLFTHIAALRSDPESSGSITGSVAYFPGGIHQKFSQLHLP